MVLKTSPIEVTKSFPIHKTPAIFAIFLKTSGDRMLMEVDLRLAIIGTEQWTPRTLLAVVFLPKDCLFFCAPCLNAAKLYYRLLDVWPSFEKQWLVISPKAIDWMAAKFDCTTHLKFWNHFRPIESNVDSLSLSPCIIWLKWTSWDILRTHCETIQDSKWWTSVTDTLLSLEDLKLTREKCLFFSALVPIQLTWTQWRPMLIESWWRIRGLLDLICLTQLTASSSDQFR